MPTVIDASVPEKDEVLVERGLYDTHDQQARNNATIPYARSVTMKHHD